MSAIVILNTLIKNIIFLWNNTFKNVYLLKGNYYKSYKLKPLSDINLV